MSPHESIWQSPAFANHREFSYVRNQLSGDVRAAVHGRAKKRGSLRSSGKPRSHERGHATKIPMELHDDSLTISREPSVLDEDVIAFTNVLDSCAVDYVIVSDYLAILTGRTRATEDVDIILNTLTEAETEALVSALKDHDYWGMAMPLAEMYSMLAEGDWIRVAAEGEMYPNFEVWFVSNGVEREAISNAITVEFDDSEIAISPIELQIAYKLRLAKGTKSTTGKDFEDALHLYLTFEEQLKAAKLEGYVEELDVEDYYVELRGV